MANAEKVLRDLLENIVRTIHYKTSNIILTPISTQGANYTSTLFSITLKAPGKDDYYLFAKVAIMGEAMREEANYIVKGFFTERYFYTKLESLFHNLEIARTVPKEHQLVVPKFYGSSDKLFNETIVLENLTQRGFTMLDRMCSIDWEYACAAVSQLAKFHALSMALKHYEPTAADSVFEELKYDLSNFVTSFSPVWEKISKTSLDLIEDEDKRARLKMFTKTNTLDTVVRMPEKRRHEVLIHGDYRTSNLMHKKNDDGTLDMIMIDFQTVQPGCVAADLMYLIFNCTDEEFRKNHYHQLLDKYFEQLQQALRLLEIEPDQVYPREDFDYEIKTMMPLGLFCGLFVLQLVTVEPDNAPKLEGVENFAVKTSDLFAKRLNGIVNDYVRWGFL